MPPKRFRRIVTGHNSEGHAVVISDGPSPHVRTSALRPGVTYTNLWTTDRMPVEIDGSPDPVTAAMNLEPPPRGSNLRIVEFAPEGEAGAIDPRAARRAFAAMGGAAHAIAGSNRHPWMHRTKTVDYGIVLSGEITLVLDDEDVVMSAGDVCIQRGTNHAWSNRSAAPCTMAFVLIDGDGLPT